MRVAYAEIVVASVVTLLGRYNQQIFNIKYSIRIPVWHLGVVLVGTPRYVLGCRAA